jgi:His-Xaa-Ser system protein HxsD
MQMRRELRVPVETIGNVSSHRIEEIRVDLRLFSIEAIKKACYKFSDRYFNDLHLSSESHAVIEFRVPATKSEEAFAAMKSEFMQEVIDQDLRERIAEETKVTRNLILTNAFADTKLIGD